GTTREGQSCAAGKISGRGCAGDAGCAGIARGAPAAYKTGIANGKQERWSPMSGKTRRQQLEELVALDPSDAESRYFLAMDHASAGDGAGAFRCSHELTQPAPESPPAYHQAGLALVRLGRTQEAREALRRGVAAARKQGNAHARDEMQALLDSLE